MVRQDEAAAQVDKVSVKLPPFWKDKPEIWFCQAEAQFELAGISKEATKFNYLVAQLDLQVVENIYDLVSSEDERKYTTAKERLLKLFRESEERQIKKLVSDLNIGDLKPSQLLQRMRGLAGDNIPDKLLKTLWLDKLPTDIRTILAISQVDLDQLADMGDKIWEMKPSSEVHSVSEPSLALTLQNVEKRLQALESRLSRSSSRDRSPSRARSRSRGRGFNPKGKYCYAHYRFGKKAQPEKCTTECKWETEKGKNLPRQKQM